MPRLAKVSHYNLPGQFLLIKKNYLIFTGFILFKLFKIIPGPFKVLSSLNLNIFLESFHNFLDFGYVFAFFIVKRFILELHDFPGFP